MRTTLRARQDGQIQALTRLLRVALDQLNVQHPIGSDDTRRMLGTHDKNHANLRDYAELPGRRIGKARPRFR